MSAQTRITLLGIGLTFLLILLRFMPENLTGPYLIVWFFHYALAHVVFFAAAAPRTMVRWES